MIALTILGISLFGMVFIVVARAVEIKKGRRIFLPEWLARRDDTVRMFFWWFERSVLELCKRCAITGTFLFVRGIEWLQGYIRSRR